MRPSLRRLRAGLVASLVCLAFAAYPSRAEDPPPEFRSEAGKSSIRFPQKPAEQARTAETPAGLIRAYLFLVPTPEVLYMAGYVDYPAATVKELGADAVLEEDRDKFVETTGGKLKSEKKITLDGHPGREFTVDGPSNARFLIREYLVGNRVYQILNRGADLTRAEIKTFQDSFKLLK